MKDKELSRKKELASTKTWQFWCAWFGKNIHDVDFDSTGLKDLEKISHGEFIRRLRKKKNK